jgi:hypothetical protein
VNKDEIVAFIEIAEKDGANIYVDKNTGIATSEFYRTEITRLDFNIDIDFHKLETKEKNEDTGRWEVNEKKTVYAPKVNVLDRIADCAGITIVKNETNEVMHNDEYGKHTAFISTCIGRKLMSDGNFKDSSMQIYEFDPLIQAMSEGTDEGKIRRKTLEYRKNAAKRAETGARLRVIRELVGLPQGFPKERAEKYFVIGRIVPNLKEIASTPRGRILAECKALGVDPAILLYGAQKVYGLLPERNVNEYTADATDGTNGGQPTESIMTNTKIVQPDFPDKPPDSAAVEPKAEPRKETEFDRLTNVLIEFMEEYRAELDVISSNGKNPYKLAAAELENKDATVDTLRSMIEKLRTYIQKKGEKA